MRDRGDSDRDSDRIGKKSDNIIKSNNLEKGFNEVALSMGLFDCP